MKKTSHEEFRCWVKMFRGATVYLADAPALGNWTLIGGTYSKETDGPRAMIFRADDVLGDDDLMFVRMDEIRLAQD